MHDRLLPTVEVESSEVLAAIFSDRRQVTLANSSAPLAPPRATNVIKSRSIEERGKTPGSCRTRIALSSRRGSPLVHVRVTTTSLGNPVRWPRALRGRT